MTFLTPSSRMPIPAAPADRKVLIVTTPGWLRFGLSVLTIQLSPSAMYEMSCAFAYDGGSNFQCALPSMMSVPVPLGCVPLDVPETVHRYWATSDPVEGFTVTTRWPTEYAVAECQSWAFHASQRAVFTGTMNASFATPTLRPAAAEAADVPCPTAYTA